VSKPFGSISLRDGMIYLTQFVGPADSMSDERRCLQVEFEGSKGNMTRDEVHTLITMLEAWERTIR